MLHPCLLLLSLLTTFQSVEGTIPDFTKNVWSSPVPYTLDSQFDDEQKGTIRAVIQKLTDNTCIDFNEDTGPGFKLEYVLHDENNVCKSAVGDVRVERNQNQKILMAKECLSNTSLFHETLHALGFRHTQSRPDRDDYVNIHSETIKKDKKEEDYLKLVAYPNFTYYGIPYEYNSIMHYDNGIYMEPKDSDYLSSIKGVRMTFNDWKMVNLHYKCNETCEEKIACNNGGYQHPRKCNVCVCPQLYGGSFCEEEPEVEILSEGEIKFLNHTFPRDDEKYLNSEGTPFEEFARATPVVIKAPDGTRIRVTIIRIFDMESPEPGPCRFKALEIIDGDLTSVGKRFCTNISNGHSFVSKTNVIGYTIFASPGLDFTTFVTFAVEKMA